MLCAALFAYAGFASLCLAMNRHHQHAWQRTPSPAVATTLKVFGWSLLGISLLACILSRNWSLGLVAWVGALSAAVLVLVFLLPYKPRTAAALALVAPVAAAVLYVV